MKSIVGMAPALTDVSRLGKMRAIYPLSVFCVRTIAILLHNGMIVDAIALLPMTLFLTALRLEKVALVARMDMLQMSFFFVLSMFQECKVLADQSQRPLQVSNANDKVTLLTTETLIRHLNKLLAIIWLLRDAPDLALDRLSTHPVENFFGRLRRIIHDVNTFNQMLKAIDNLGLMNEGVKALSLCQASKI
jgi:hypothetical protein